MGQWISTISRGRMRMPFHDYEQTVEQTGGVVTKLIEESDVILENDVELLNKKTRNWLTRIDGMLQEKLQLISELDEKILNDIKTQGRATNRENPRSCQLSKSKERRNKISSSNRGRRLEKKETLATSLKESDKKIDLLFW